MKERENEEKMDEQITTWTICIFSTPGEVTVDGFLFGVEIFGGDGWEAVRHIG